ncbi:Chromatin structure-remodeling complex protein rsc9 [Sorochytrium milnesiophthora]
MAMVQPRNLTAADADTEYLTGGFQNRMLLALESRLPNEIDWALGKFCRLSYSSDYFHLQSVPGLMEALVDICEEFLDSSLSRVSLATSSALTTTTTTTTSSSTAASASSSTTTTTARETQSMVTLQLFAGYDQAAMQERATLICQCLYNLTTAQTNFRYLSSHPAMHRLLFRGISLPPLSCFVEIRRICLDTLQSIALATRGVVGTGGAQTLVVPLQKMLFDNDRHVVVSALYALQKVSHLELNEAALDVHGDDTVLAYLFSLLCAAAPAADEEMVTAVLDYLYQLSLVSNSLAAQIGRAAQTNPVRILLRFLAWGSDDESNSPNGPINSEPLGIPLTACLLMRNLARSPANDQAFWSTADDIVLAATKYPRLSAYILQITDAHATARAHQDARLLALGLL